MQPIETHPLPPFVPPHATLLMLGSFPPPHHRWNMDFYYPNLQNDMWRIFGLVFFEDKDYFLKADGNSFKEEQIRDFLYHKGIAISDTAHRVVRLANNAADKSLKIIEPLDLNQLLDKLPHCRDIMTTGELATSTLLSLLPAATKAPRIAASSSAIVNDRNLVLYRLPSSSRAYPLALEKKAATYREFFERLEMR
ncbi:MAG: uracil-DNA glycosylase family protein [Alcaligenaceae bacterium]|nr:uracil-DNA glycosylase family protein [Alcaligenaceae bacterium]